MDFAPLAGQLAMCCRLIAIDSQGPGRSALGAATLGCPRLADDIAAVLAYLGHGRRGTSATAMEVSSRSGLPRLAWCGMFAKQVERHEAEHPDPEFARLFETTRAMWLGSGADAYPGETVGAISAPLMVIHGDEDFFVSRRQAFELAQRVEGSRLLNLPFASHTVLEDASADVLPALASFMEAMRQEVPIPGS